VVRDHEDGTNSGGWCRAVEAELFGARWEWTHRVEQGGGATKLAGGRMCRRVGLGRPPCHPGRGRHPEGDAQGQEVGGREELARSDPKRTRKTSKTPATVR